MSVSRCHAVAADEVNLFCSAVSHLSNSSVLQLLRLHVQTVQHSHISTAMPPIAGRAWLRSHSKPWTSRPPAVPAALRAGFCSTAGLWCCDVWQRYVVLKKRPLWEDTSSLQTRAGLLSAWAPEPFPAFTGDQNITESSSGQGGSYRERFHFSTWKMER